jgi:hypothetical protein
MPDAPSTVQALWGAAVLTGYAGYGVWGILLERRAERFRRRPAARGARWAEADFAPEGRRLVAANRRWERFRRLAWIGGIALLCAGALLPPG